MTRFRCSRGRFAADDSGKPTAEGLPDPLRVFTADAADTADQTPAFGGPVEDQF